MKVDCALLCDAVTVREGLLHILGGAITRINRTEYPGPAGVALAMRIMVHPTEVAQNHVVKIIMQTSDGARLIEAEINFLVEEMGDLVPGEEFSVPVQFPMHGIAIPGAGGYSIEILIDGVHHRSVPFQAVIVQGV